MQSMSARDAKNAFGRLIDMASAESVVIEKYGRSVVVVLAVEELGRLKAQEEAGGFCGIGQTPGATRLT